MLANINNLPAQDMTGQGCIDRPEHDHPGRSLPLVKTMALSTLRRLIDGFDLRDHAREFATTEVQTGLTVELAAWSIVTKKAVKKPSRQLFQGHPEPDCSQKEQDCGQYPAEGEIQKQNKKSPGHEQDAHAHRAHERPQVFFNGFKGDA